MSSEHADPALTVRPPADLTAQAKQVLGGRDRTMRGFVVACLTALTADPDRFLTQLERHWPADKPRGRPRHREPTAPSADNDGAAGDQSRRRQVHQRPEPVDPDTARLERVPGTSGWRVLAALAADPDTVIVVGTVEPVRGTDAGAGARGWRAYHGHVQVTGGPWRARRDAVVQLLLQHARFAEA